MEVFYFKFIIMNYEKAYNEALERARKELSACNGDCDARRQIYRLFPELRESEDKQSHKRIEQLIRLNTSGAERTRLLAYLEKQKPINECNTHEPTLEEARKWNEAYEKGYSLGYENGKNEQKPSWSERDFAILHDLIQHFDPKFLFHSLHYPKETIVDFLQSLCPQPHWKPSSLELQALKTAIHILTEERNFPKAVQHLKDILDHFDSK